MVMATTKVNVGDISKKEGSIRVESGDISRKEGSIATAAVKANSRDIPEGTGELIAGSTRTGMRCWQRK